LATRGAALLLHGERLRHRRGEAAIIATCCWPGKGWAPPRWTCVGLAFDDLGDKKLDAISVGPVISE
jgi:hypothetical protein